MINTKPPPKLERDDAAHLQCSPCAPIAADMTNLTVVTGPRQNTYPGRFNIASAVPMDSTPSMGLETLTRTPPS
eukprot:1128354-Pleurochrysis_carterae.AAC.1